MPLVFDLALEGEEVDEVLGDFERARLGSPAPACKEPASSLSLKSPSTPSPFKSTIRLFLFFLGFATTAAKFGEGADDEGPDGGPSVVCEG